MLTKRQLKQLRNEIVLNSLFYKDYSNSLYIKEKTACDFFDGYVEYLLEIAQENNIKTDSILDIIYLYDNINNLWNYYNLIEGDALPRDNYIAYKNDSVFSGLVIYYLSSDYVICASYFLSGYDNHFNNDKTTRNKLYYSSKKDDYYFIKHKTRYYLKDFMRVDYEKN